MVVDGQACNATNLNNAFLSRTQNSDTVGIVGLNNTIDPSSGNQILNTQKAINKLFDSDGTVGEVDANAKVYASTNVVVNGDSRKTAIERIDQEIPNIYAAINAKYDVTRGQFTIANNTASQVVTGLLFDLLVYRQAEVKWTVYRKSTGGGGQIRVQTGAFYLIHDDTTWALTDQSMSGSFAGVTFDVVGATGQVELTSDDNGGVYDGATSILDFSIVNLTEITP